MPGETYAGEACTDCLMLIANGDTSGNPRCETEEGEAEYLADIDRHSDGIHWVPSSWPYEATLIGDVAYGDTVPDDGGTYEVDEMYGDIYRTGWTDDDRYYGADRAPRFTVRRSCDVCGSTIGGDRYPVAGFPS